jgi:hypothetical protein
MLYAWGDEKCVQTLVRIPEGDRPLERHKSKWEDNIKINPKEMRF